MQSHTQPPMWAAREPRQRLAALLCGALLTVAVGAVSKVRADVATNAETVLIGEVLVVHASEAEGPVDPSLSHIRALKHPPFDNYKSMKILTRSAVKLELDQPVEIDLPNGRKLHLLLVARLADGRSKVQVSINRPHKKDYLPLLQVIASPGEPFFVAGQKFEGGTLVIGVRIGERARPL